MKAFLVRHSCQEECVVAERSFLFNIPDGFEPVWSRLQLRTKRTRGCLVGISNGFFWCLFRVVAGILKI